MWVAPTTTSIRLDRPTDRPPCLQHPPPTRRFKDKVKNPARHFRHLDLAKRHQGTGTEQALATAQAQAPALALLQF